METGHQKVGAEGGVAGDGAVCYTAYTKFDLFSLFELLYWFSVPAKFQKL